MYKKALINSSLQAIIKSTSGSRRMDLPITNLSSSSASAGDSGGFNNASPIALPGGEANAKQMN